MKNGSASCQRHTLRCVSCWTKPYFESLCFLQQSQERASVHTLTPPPPPFSFSMMRRQTEEILCMERIKRKGIEKKGGAKKWWEKEVPWGEKLSVPGRHQTHRRPVISLHPGSPLTAPWLCCLDSSRLARTYTCMLLLATTRALAPADLLTHAPTHSNSTDVSTLMFTFHTYKDAHLLWYPSPAKAPLL